MTDTTASRSLPWNQNQEKFVVHSAAIENRKVLDSRENGEWNVKLGLTTIESRLWFYNQRPLVNKADWR